MTEDIQRKVSRRLRIVDGQIRGLERMVKVNKYCIDIITQTSAVKQALSSIEDLILENHLATHLVEQVKHGQSRKATGEVLKVYKLSKHR